MKTTTEEIIKEILNKELEKIKDELTPHFKDFGKVVVEGFRIKLEYYDIDNFDTIVYLDDDSTYNNRYANSRSRIYNHTNIDIHDIFEDIGNALSEIKVKPLEK